MTEKYQPIQPEIIYKTEDYVIRREVDEQSGDLFYAQCDDEGECVGVAWFEVCERTFREEVQVSHKFINMLMEDDRNRLDSALIASIFDDFTAEGNANGTWVRVRAADTVTRGIYAELGFAQAGYRVQGAVDLYREDTHVVSGS